jgi:hypothetical protein
MKKIAIVALTRGYDNLESYQYLITRNQHIQHHILSKSQYNFDLILFHEGNISKDHQEYIIKESGFPLQFRDVREHGDKLAFDNNRDLINEELCPPTELSLRFEVGYKHMCHFWSIGLFSYMSDYDYVIRMDEDVFVLGIDPSIIDSIISEDIKFAIPNICPVLDDPNVIVGLDVLLDRFYQKHNIQPSVRYQDILAPNTNFMILNLQYFKNHNLIQDFLAEVDASKGIYSNRWGDAPIWGIILYALQNEPFYLCDTIEYFHGSHGHHVNQPNKPVFYGL